MLWRCAIIFLAVYMPSVLSVPQVRSSGRTGHSRDLAFDRKAKSRSGVSHQVGDLVNELFGDSVGRKTSRALNAVGGDDVTEENRLDCDFESNCCWANVDSGDRLDWAVYEGDTDKKRLEQNFGSGKKPTGNFLAVVSSSARSETHDARFGSCSIACAQHDVQVSLKYWITAAVKLSLCTRTVLLDKERGPLENCKDLSAASGVAIITLPARRNEAFDVVVVAKGFVNAGSAAMIDDITVAYKPCIRNKGSRTNHVDSDEPISGLAQSSMSVAALNTETKTQRNSAAKAAAKAVLASKEECKQVTCDFENNDSCSYVDNSELNKQSTNDTFQVRMGRFKNPVTGIARPGDGIHYIAAYLKHGSVAKLETTVELSEDRVIRFQHYEATAGIMMKGCCDDDDNCPFQTNPEVNAIDLKWSTSSFQCPAGTKKICFACTNEAFNEGSCGLDSIELFAGSADPDAAVDNLCQSQ